MKSKFINRFLLGCLGGIIICISIQAESRSSYYFSNLNLEDGLSQISVVDIHQDAKGYMWFATRNGLNRYDGSRFTVYKHIPEDSLSLNDNHVTRLAEDRLGNLWIGTATGLNRMQLKTDRVVRFTKSDSQLFAHGVRSLLVDSDDRVWIGTSRGLVLYVREADVFQTIDLNGQIRGEFISSLYETSEGLLLIGTATKGLYVCDKELRIIKHYSGDSGETRLPGNNIGVIYEDSGKQIWLGLVFNGLCRLDMETDEIVSYRQDNSELTNNNIRCLMEYEGSLFVGTFDGLYSVDIATRRLSSHLGAGLKKGNLNHFSIYSLYVDNSGIVWVGTYAGGVNYFSKYNNRFSFHEPTNVFNQILGIYGAVVCRPPDCMYIATEGGGLLDYNLKSGRYQNYLMEEGVTWQPNQNIAKSVMVEEDVIWSGTNRGKIYTFDTRTKKYDLYHDFLRNMAVYVILRGSDGSIWAGTSDPRTGLIRFSPDKEIQDRFEVNGRSDPFMVSSVRALLEIRPGVFLIGTRNNGLFKYNIQTKDLTVYDVNQEHPYRLLNNYVTTIFRDRTGRIWIGLFGGGLALYDEELGIVETATKKDGLVDNDVCTIVEDNEGYFWISTSNGIARYDAGRKEFTNYDRYSGIAVQEFTPHSGTLLPNGHICFGGNNGFIIFDPEDLEQNSFLPPVVYTDLKVNNETVHPEDGGILTAVLDETEKIVLRHYENNLSIGYCALNYIYPDQNRYAYRLDGHDLNWNQVGNRKEAFYTNLPPGSYTFEVKAANNDGIWNDRIKTLEVVILPPVWKTWYAYAGYLLLFLLITGLIFYYIQKKQLLERELEFKMKERHQQEEFHQAKIRMFTNFSHELRTPLTLIISPLQELMNRTDFPAAVKNKLSLISSNSHRLLLLVNQLMDLRKNQSGKMQLKIAKADICSFVREIYCAFNQIAQNKQVNFEFNTQEEGMDAWFDKSLVEKVIFNLLSNAFKFTPAGGKVELALKKLNNKDLSPEQRKELNITKEDTQWIHFSVSDTGKGIPEEEVRNIFAPFYQIEDNDQKQTVGSGIGLSLSYSIVKLHQGIIWVENNHPQGSLFHVILPVSKSVYPEEQIQSTVKDSVITETPTPAGQTFEINKKYTVLLVEDNEEVRRYLKEALDVWFTVLEAENGNQGWQIASEQLPDLIVSDIMMPEMDGLQLCAAIKKDLQTGHIPVILMTAKSMVVHIKEGFSAGADDYIVKPFNIEVLLYRMKSLLESRDKLKSLYGKKFSPESLGIELISGDDRFTQKFFGVIEKHISNPDLNIDIIVNEIGLSRANLYRKLKAITELSPTELIRNKRMEIAARLLLESDMTVSEISFEVGFNSHAYFTNSFKTVYGCSPSEFIQKQKE